MIFCYSQSTVPPTPFLGSILDLTLNKPLDAASKPELNCMKIQAEPIISFSPLILETIISLGNLAGEILARLVEAVTREVAGILVLCHKLAYGSVASMNN